MLGKVVDLGPGHIVLVGDPVGTQLPTTAPPHFRPMPIVAKLPLYNVMFFFSSISYFMAFRYQHLCYKHPVYLSCDFWGYTLQLKFAYV